MRKMMRISEIERERASYNSGLQMNYFIGNLSGIG
jgi:hypothetical protein